MYPTIHTVNILQQKVCKSYHDRHKQLDQSVLTSR